MIVYKDRQKDFLALTNEEIEEIAKDIFQAKGVKQIRRDCERGMITFEMSSEWYTLNNGKRRKDVILDEVRIMNPFDHGADAIQVPWEESEEEYTKLKQYCFAKGIYGASIMWLIDNPYVQDAER